MINEITELYNNAVKENKELKKCLENLINFILQDKCNVSVDNLEYKSMRAKLICDICNMCDEMEV